MNCKNKTKKHSLTLRVGFTDREWCWLVVSGKGMASFPLWAFHGRVRRQDHDPSLTQSNQSNRKKCYPLLFSLLNWCDKETERMAQVYYFKSSLQHLKKQGVWIEGWKRTMFRERKRENVFLKIVLTELVPRVCWIINLWCEMCLLGRSLFDELNCVDLISANAWDVKKSTIALIAHLLTELSHYPCWTIYWGGDICPLWRPLSLWLSMLMRWMVQIREVLMQNMWKNQKSHW